MSQDLGRGQPKARQVARSRPRPTNQTPDKRFYQSAYHTGFDGKRFSEYKPTIKRSKIVDRKMPDITKKNETVLQ